MALFLDIHPLSQQASNDALEFLYKSTHDRDPGIWSLHESVLIRRLVELFTQRGLDRLDEVRKQLHAWETGGKHKPSTAPMAKPGLMTRWSTAELGMVKLYLESLPVAAWTFEDHMMAVDFVVQTYLPTDALKTEAEWLATRATLMGKVQANLEAEATPKQADALLAALPATPHAAAQFTALNNAQRAALEYGAARCAENVRALTDVVRHKMRRVVMEHVEAQMQSPVGSPGEALQTRLMDEFATLNRDWRRIAITEAGECQLQGFIASLPPGTQVKRVEKYANACNHCKKIDGKIMTVAAADAADKNGETQVWPGKTNIGRSAAPRKRVGDELVPREPHERWWIAAGTQHPHCRGRWVRVLEAEPGDDPAFAEWLRNTLAS